MQIGSALKIIISFGFMITSVLAQYTDLLPISLPGLKIPKNLNIRVLEIDSFEDWIYASLYIGVFFIFKFIGFSSLLEVTNPIPKTNYRTVMMKKQILYGLWALVFVILCTTFYFWKIEAHMPYYGYYETHDFGLVEGLLNLVIYMFCFDTWFYFTHKMFHIKFLWKHIHLQHHQFLEPTAFGQDAVHPIEAIVQGPFGHFICCLVYPIHPVAQSVFGMLTSIFAIFAHDGRWDPNNHQAHHTYAETNFALYWGFWDYVFGCRYNPKIHGVHKPTWERPDKGESLLGKDKMF